MFLKRLCSGTFQITVTSTNIVDITYAIYILILCIVDAYYSNDFVLYELKWRSSVTCFLLFNIAFNFNLPSPISLCFLTFGRLIIVVLPSNEKIKDIKFVIGLICKTSAVFAFITFIVTYLVKILYKKVPMNICSL